MTTNDHRLVGRDEHVHDWLSEYLDGALDEAERQAVDAHLTTCAQCRANLASLRLTVQALQQLPLRPVPHSFAVPAPAPRPAPRLVWLRWTTGALAAMFVALLAVRLVLPGASGPSAEPAAPAAAPAVAVAPAAAPTSAASSAQPVRSIAVRPVAAVPNGAAVPTPNRANRETTAITPASAAPGGPSAGAPPPTIPPGAPTAAAAGSAPALAAAAPTPTRAEYPGAAAPAPAASAYPYPSPALAPTSASYPNPVARPSRAYPKPQTSPGAAYPNPQARPASPVAASGPVWYSPALAVLGVLVVVSAVVLYLLGRRR